MLGIFIYIRTPFQDFEDGHRELKVSHFLIFAKKLHAENKDAKVVVEVDGHDQPLYSKTENGETSIPRKVFYDICDEYRPCAKEVIVTLL